MRIQLASDLHLEHLQSVFHGECLIRPAHQADVLVLAGDIAHAPYVAELFGQWPVPVLYVMGNHEFYGSVYEDERERTKELFAGTSVRYLEREVADFGGVRFLGATLWTDYRYRCNRTQRQLMDEAERRIRDHYVIKKRDGSRLLAQDVLEEHLASRAWLQEELRKPYDGVTVVVSHHGPHPLSVHPRYSGDALNAAFVSDLTELLPLTDYWLHGHVHDHFDYRVGRCRVVANPRGYALDRFNAPSVKALQFENKSFKPALVLDTYDVRAPATS